MKDDIPDNMVQCSECNVIVMKHSSHGGYCSKCYLLQKIKEEEDYWEKIRAK